MCFEKLLAPGEKELNLMASSYQVPSTSGSREKKLSILRNTGDWKTLQSFHSVWEEPVVSFLIARALKI